MTPKSKARYTDAQGAMAVAKGVAKKSLVKKAIAKKTEKPIAKKATPAKKKAETKNKVAQNAGDTSSAKYEDILSKGTAASYTSNTSNLPPVNLEEPTFTPRQFTPSAPKPVPVKRSKSK